MRRFGKRTVWWAGIGALVVAAVGCRDEQAGPRPKGARAPVAAGAPGQTSRSSTGAAATGATPGEGTFRSGATWANGAVMYLGSKVSPARVRAGENVTVTHFFKATQTPPKGYQFFVHIVDPTNGQMLMNGDHEIQNGAMPLERWPVNQVIQDSMTFPAPDAPSGQARVLLGFWQGNERLHADDRRMTDGNDRVIGPPIELTSGSLPEYHVHKTAHAPKIDGDLSDAVWAAATPVDLVGSFDGKKTQLRTTARMLYDDTNVYVAFDCEDPDVWGTLMKRDDPIYNEEAVEIFIDANADGKTYNELEVSPNNTIFDAYFPARREGMDLSWDSGMKSAVKVRGTINDPSDRDEGWTVEMQIPIAKLAEVPNVPPKRGDKWRFNLYRLEHLGRKQVEGSAFSPLFMGDFHNLPRFGWLVFE